MKGTYAATTYRHGRPLAACLRSERLPGDVAARTEKVDGGSLRDLTDGGRPTGIEIASPRGARLETPNRVLRPVHPAPPSSEDLASLVAG